MTVPPKDETRTPADNIVELTPRKMVRSEENELTDKGRKMVQFLRETADELELGQDIPVNVLIVLKLVNLERQVLTTDVRSLSDDDSDLAMLARAQDMILHR